MLVLSCWIFTNFTKNRFEKVELTFCDSYALLSPPIHVFLILFCNSPFLIVSRMLVSTYVSYLSLSEMACWRGSGILLSTGLIIYKKKTRRTEDGVSDENRTVFSNQPSNMHGASRNIRTVPTNVFSRVKECTLLQRFAYGCVGICRVSYFDSVRDYLLSRI